METDAATLLELAILNVPGLLQTEPYMRAQFAAHRLRPDRIEAEVSARLFRQRRLVDEEFPLELVAIVDESALRKSVGGPEVMRGQLRRLVESGELSNVSVQVLPGRAGSHPGADGAYTILDFPEDDPSVLYVACVVGAIHIEKPEEVALARLKFDQLRSEALSPKESVALIERLAGEL